VLYNLCMAPYAHDMHCYVKVSLLHDQLHWLNVPERI